MYRVLVQLPVTTNSLQLEGSSDTMPGITRSPTLAYWHLIISAVHNSLVGLMGRQVMAVMVIKNIFECGTMVHDIAIYIYQYHQYHGSYGSYDNYWLYDTDIYIYIMISWQLSVSWYIYISVSSKYHDNYWYISWYWYFDDTDIISSWYISTDDILMIFLRPFQTIPSQWIPSDDFPCLWGSLSQHSPAFFYHTWRSMGWRNGKNGQISTDIICYFLFFLIIHKFI